MDCFVLIVFIFVLSASSFLLVTMFNVYLHSGELLLAPQSGALRRGAYRDFQPIPSYHIGHIRPEGDFFATKKSKQTALGDLSRMFCYF